MLYLNELIILRYLYACIESFYTHHGEYFDNQMLLSLRTKLTVEIIIHPFIKQLKGNARHCSCLGKTGKQRYTDTLHAPQGFVLWVRTNPTIIMQCKKCSRSMSVAQKEDPQQTHTHMCTHTFMHTHIPCSAPLPFLRWKLGRFPRETSEPESQDD